MRSSNSKNIYLDAKEKLLLESYENDEWQEIENLKQVKKQAIKAATNCVKILE